MEWEWKFPEPSQDDVEEGQIRTHIACLEKVLEIGKVCMSGREKGQQWEMARIAAQVNGNVALYQRMYDECDCWGKFKWTQMRLLGPKALQAVLDDSLTLFLVLYVDDKPTGFADVRLASNDSSAEIKYFGITQNCTSCGWGSLFLRNVLALLAEGSERAPAVRRCWLNTCNWDSAAALRVYRRAEFKHVRDWLQLEPRPSTTWPQ